MRSDFLNIDCMEYMKGLEDDYFDLVIADPPYGLNLANNPFRGKFEKSSWDLMVPSDVFFMELMRVSRNQIIWGGNYFSLPPTKGFVIWDKKQGETFSSAMCEYAWTSFDVPAKIFRFDARKRGENIHPTQKPIALYAWLLKNYAKEGDLVFDPMAGSGNSRIAAYQMGFDYVGCEINPTYYYDAVEHYNKLCRGIYRDKQGREVVQGDLFS